MKRHDKRKMKEDMKGYYNTSKGYLEHLMSEGGSEDYNWSGYVKFASRHINDGEKVLELGCGVGTASVMLNKKRKIRMT
ncbi:hypothetical protein JXB11_01960, partial [Candidatus Woesearchaeota archaeon]|nr:hypothetical protein [Candidatus Woesearchaeota archaeon]